MSRGTPPAWAGRLGLPGSNPRAAMGESPATNSNLYDQGQQGGLRSPSAPAPRSPAASRHGEKSMGTPSGGSKPVRLRVEKVSDKSLQSRLIFGNICAVSPDDFPPSRHGNDFYILISGGEPAGEFVVSAKPVPGFPQGCISLSDPQRSWCGITMRDEFIGRLHDPFASGGKAYLGSLDLEIGFASTTKKTEAPYDEDELCKVFLQTFQAQVLAPRQIILMDVRNIPLRLIVKTVGLVDLAMSSDDSGKQNSTAPEARGILTDQTRVVFHRDGKGDFNMKPSMSKPNSNAILAPDFKFEDMGIGGLGNEFSTIFRRAFASRVFPPGLVAKMGIPHVKGMLLYGPPGTGKTLMARQIGKMLNARPPKVINGPEVLNKYVGQSEENIRKLFADAEKEYKEKGDESSLHIIIFDELDAVCKQRGSGAGGGTGVGDSVVNQLLSKLDGVDQLNNILLIGMTNRKDMIDDALLRPGRLEVHVEIPLPNEAGRLEIFHIRASKLKNNDLLAPDVDFAELASMTKNYSGAEIDGIVKAAGSYAFSRHTEVGGMAQVKPDVANMKVKREDFINALEDVRPAFGIPEAELNNTIPMGIISYGPHVDHTIQAVLRFAAAVRESDGLFSSSVLFHGPTGSGKTALAAHIAMQSGFPFVKLITPADLVGFGNDIAKKDHVHRAFTDAYKSPASIIILDDFERLIGWNATGQRYSSMVLNTLTTLVVSKPPKGHRLLVLATTSQLSVLNMLEVDRDFRKKIPVPALSNTRELGAVLQSANGVFDAGEINQVLNTVQERTGSNAISVGIKIVFEHMMDAQLASKSTNASTAELFSELLLDGV